MSLMSLCHTNLISRLFCSFYVGCSVSPDDDENCQTSSFSLICEPSSYLPALVWHGTGTAAILFCGHLSWPEQQSFYSFKCPSPRTVENQENVKAAYFSPSRQQGVCLRSHIGQRGSATEMGLR